MAGKKPTGDLVTRISLDGAQPVQTLKSLRAEVSSTTSAWRAHAAELKSTGDQLGAAKAKYDGLSQTIEKQKNLLTQQKDELQKLRQAQNEVDTSTAKGKQEYEGYAAQIAKAENNVAKATTKLASLTSQQEKAKQSLDYYESGLAKAQTELRNISSASNTYVQRLEAEGKQEEANKVKLESLGQQYGKLNEIYRIQSTELNKIANEAGKSSDAYRIQKQRVDQTATSLAKTKTQMTELSESMNKANPSVFDRIKAKITGVNSETKKTHSSLKEMFMGSFLGNALSNALGSVTGQLSTIYSDGMKANEALEKINGRFKAMGATKKDIEGLDAELTKIKTNTAMNGEEVAQLQMKMMNWSVIGKKGAQQMAEGIAAVGDNSKMSGDKVSALGAQLMRVGTNGKVTASQISRIAKSAPSLYSDLAKSAGVSEEKMKSMLATGDVTQKQFQEWVAGISKSSSKAFKDFDTTQEGSTKRMQDSWASLKAKMTKPLFEAKTSGLNALSDFMTDPGIQKGAQAIGDAIAKGMGYLSKHRKDISEITKDLFTIGSEVAKDVWKTFSSILGTIGDAFGHSAKNAKDAKDPIKNFARGMDALAENKTAIKVIADAIVAMAAVKTLSPVVSGISGIVGAASKGYKGVRALRKGIKGVDDISELKGPEKALAKLGSTASTIAKGIKKDIGSALSGQSLGGSLQSLKSAGGFGGLKTAGKVTSAAAGVGVALDAGSSIVSAFKDKGGSMKQYQDAGKGIGSAIGGGIGMWFGGPAGAMIGSQIGKVVGGWGGKAVKNFQNGWNSKKPPKNFWSLENLGWSTHDTINKVGKAGKDAVGSLAKGWKSNKPPKKLFSLEGLGFVAKNFTLTGIGIKAVESLTKGWKSKKPPKNFWSLENLGWSAKDMFGKVNKGMSDFWKKSKSGFKDWSRNIAKNSQSFVKNFGPNMNKGFNKFLDNGHNFFKKFNTNMGNFFKDLPKNKYVKAFQKGQLFQVAYKDIQKKTKKWTKDFSKSWNKHWNDSQKTVRTWADKTHKNYTKGTKYLEKTFNAYTRSAKKKWSSHWNSLQKNINGFWTKAKKVSSKGTSALLKQVKSYAKNEQKQWNRHYDDVHKLSDNFHKNMEKNHGNMLKALRDTAKDQLDNIKDKWQRHWSDVQSGSSKWGSNMNRWFNGFSSDWQSGWQSLNNKISDIFSTAWDKMKKLAQDGMNGLIDIVNGGIGAVDKVIGYFGGNSNAIKYVDHVKLATGTGYFGTQRRAITKPTLAMVNDGNDSPETGNREALYRPATGDFGIFQGRNVSTILQPGDEILNATETKMLMQSMGMSHFAEGTGWFSGIIGKVEKGVSGAFNGIASWAKSTTQGLKNFFDLAEKIIQNPSGYLDTIFKWTGISNLNSGAMKDIAQGGYNKAKDQANSFWKEMWSMVSGSLDGGGAEGGLLGAVEKYGKGHPYVWGAAGPDAFDCSGLVMYALEHAFGKSFPHYSGAQYSASVAVSDPQPGDLVFFGPGGSEHVGVYAGGDNYYSAQSPSASPNIGMGKISQVGEGPVSYRRIPGLKGEGGSTEVKANNGLQQFIKDKVGKGFWDFISKLSSLFGIDADGDPGGAGVQRWGEVIKRAAEKMHTSVTGSDISKILSMIQAESGGNPKAVQPGADPDGDGSGPARGLLQFKTSTFNAFTTGGNIYNGESQLEALFNDSNWKNDIHYGGGWGPTGHRRYANGGIANEPSIFGEAGPEMAIPLSAAKSSRTYELIGKTAAIAASRDNIQPENHDNRLVKKFDQVIDLLTSILASPSTVETNINMDKQSVGNAVTEVVNARMRLNAINRKKGISGIR